MNVHAFTLRFDVAELLIVCSPGGHFLEAQSLIEGMDYVDFKFVIHSPPQLLPEIFTRTIVAPHAERDIRIIKQMLFAFYCVWKERPKVVISTGALIGVTFGLAGKLFGARFIFVESPTRVTSPSLAGRICYKFADTFYVRYAALIHFFPNAICSQTD